MFYTDSPEEALRFGDVVHGFILSAANLSSPLVSDAKTDYQIAVSCPAFSVILSPCCSIGDKTLTLAPLSPVPPSFFSNPYLKEDLTRVNRVMTAQQSVPPVIWASMSEEQKAKRFDLSRPMAYAIVETFVYAPSDHLPMYTVNRREGNIETGHYMIDFRRLHRIECPKVNSPTQSPLEAKILQLTIEARGQLRDKLAHYFGRAPREDQV